MKVKQNLISKSLSKPTRELLSDVSELGIDETIDKMIQDSELLKQLPIIKWMFIGNDIRSSLQSAFFLKKYANFIGMIDNLNISENDRNNLNLVLSDEVKIREIIDNTMIYLDRYQNEQKAKLLGELFNQTFKYKKFSNAEYNLLMFSIELINPYNGIDILKKFYEYRISMDAENKEEEKRKIWSEGSRIDYSALSTSGLLSLPKGGAYVGDLGGAFLNDLGKKFYELVVLNC